MTLCSEVKNRVDLLRLQHIRNEARTEDVSLFLTMEIEKHFNELVVGIGFNLLQILQRRAVIQTIHVDDVVLRVLLHQVNNNVGGTKIEEERSGNIKPAPPVMRMFLGV